LKNPFEDDIKLAPSRYEQLESGSPFTGFKRVGPPTEAGPSSLVGPSHWKWPSSEGAGPSSAAAGPSSGAGPSRASVHVDTPPPTSWPSAPAPLQGEGLTHHLPKIDEQEPKATGPLREHHTRSKGPGGLIQPLPSYKAADKKLVSDLNDADPKTMIRWFNSVQGQRFFHRAVGLTENDRKYPLKPEAAAVMRAFYARYIGADTE